MKSTVMVAVVRYILEAADVDSKLRPQRSEDSGVRGRPTPISSGRGRSCFRPHPLRALLVASWAGTRADEG
jgi:hypothetical protein